MVGRQPTRWHSTLYIMWCVWSWALLGVSDAAMGDGIDWKQYSDANHGFCIQYPSASHVEAVQEKEPWLISRVAFEFEQPFQKGEDVGSLKFSFQITVWQNPDHLDEITWAKRDASPRLTSEVCQIRVAGRDGITLHTTNLAWTTVKTFVADKGRMYELSYMDLAWNELLSHETRSRWSAVFDAMVKSFRFLPQDDKSN
jgi:hypothetical protein